MKEVNFEQLAHKINQNISHLTAPQSAWFASALKLSESPMESLLASALARLSDHPVPQFVITPYRIDSAYAGIRLAVEADGYKYHKVRWMADCRRDRMLLLAGWRVLRFAGAEVWRDAAGCASEIESAYLALSK